MMFGQMKALALAAMMAFGLTGAANAATVVGSAAIDRSTSDSYSNFAIALTNDIFPTGVITGWETYIKAIDGNAATGMMSLLVLNNVGGANYDVVGIDTRTVGTGLNSFSTSLSVTSGDILAILMGSAKVAYDLNPGGSNSVGPDPYSGNGAFGTLPTVGQTIALNAGGTSRTYSINATVVPLPAAGLLLLTAFGGFAALRRRKAKAA